MLANALEPGIMHPIIIGVLGGINLPLSPSELVNKPTTATQYVQQSLLNGLNGLGFQSTYNFGIVAKYTLSKKFLLGANIEYSGWKSINSCNCNDTIGKSENKLTLFHFGFFLQYFIYKNLYAVPEISFNILGARVTENSVRGNLDFSKSYPRIGAGLGLGYEIPLTNKFTFDLSAKRQFLNLLLNKENHNTNSESESLINSKNETKEATLFILSFNIGILFTL
ncbi:MAG: hypothetical protein A2X61_13325 [Ignavibacteria bacterium GWB2_35_12]|nr:MAG: hypothetical protein A2X63_12535 [Ignavibacteria bacterium GWA2_35_8]OGU41440.1 MAG: hypothetical protein A2X61_13325 [Ignavibacteria bacterium GWB2_35_12]OGU94997.1 MAG: hypothetical protein A2220_09515 [Ignavibacteria bacterium RIFOXYA2_FULL_35_10]OGV19384.1 MAG: hypothetical protein A2475_04765 [Ignavibacteria bacterium RIFOXYC2_FULL_35_21]